MLAIIFRLRTIVIALLICFSFTAYGQGSSTPLWKIYYDSGNLYLKADAPRAVNLFSKAENIARNDLGIYDDNYLTILNALGLSNENAHNFPQAQKYLEQTVNLGREVYRDEDPRMLRPLYNLGLFYRKSGNFEASSDLFNRIFALAGRSGDRNFYILAATQVVTIAESKHKLDSALLIARKVISSSDLKNYESITYDLQLAEGRILRKQKMYDEAQKVLINLQKQLIARGSAFRTLTRAVSIQISMLDIDLGRYSKAEQDLLQLYRSVKAETNEDLSLLAEITNSTAFVYEKLGVYDKALAYYAEALNYCVAGSESVGMCDVIQNNIAGIHLKLKRFDKAIAEYKSYVDSRTDKTRLKDPAYLAALNNLATALRQSGKVDEALQYFNEIYRSLEQENRGEEDLAATVLNNIGVAQTLNGHYNEATGNFRKALKIKETFYGKDSPLLLELCSNLGVSLWAAGLRAESLPYFRRSLQLGLREVKYHFEYLTEAEQLQFYAQQKENFERFNTLAVQSSAEMPEMLVQMFNNQVFLKSLIFFTNRRATATVKEMNDPALKKAFELKQQKSIQLGNHYQSTLDELKSKGISLMKLEQQIDSLDKVIRHKLPNNQAEGDFVTWNDIQRAVPDDGASVDIIRFRKYDALPNKTSGVKIGFTDSIYYAALVTTAQTRSNPELVLMRNGRELETRFFAYYKNTTRFDFDDTLTVVNFWDPIESKIKDKKKIHFTPDGIYRQINLNTIRDRKRKYNIEKYEIVTSLNPAGLIAKDRSKAVDLSKTVLMGDAVFGIEQAKVGAASIQSSFSNLPGTQKEIAEISKLIRSSPPPTQYIRAQASEQNLRKIKSPGVLHIATHGYFSVDVSYLNEQVKSDYLFHSGLLLSAGKTESNPTENDGIVTAYDIINMDLSKTDLVVLSACETGVGKNEFGEGIHGLQRSFMLAGAKDIVISLWRVDDNVTKDVMIRFYQYLLQKNNPNDALRLAQIDIMKKEPARRLWGSFVTVGSN
jgi:CHAT domain-containing protein/Tfp pilus assembly protein PilF